MKAVLAAGLVAGLIAQAGAAGHGGGTGGRGGTRTNGSGVAVPRVRKRTFNGIRVTVGATRITRPTSLAESVYHSMCDEEPDITCSVLGGFPSVAYHADLQLGSRNRTLRLVVDTGSGNLAVAGTALSKLPGVWTYNATESTTGRNTGSTFEVNYVEGHISGTVWSDTVGWTAGGVGDGDFTRQQADALAMVLGPINADIGVIDSQAAFFQQNARQYQYDGIMGLGYSSIATDGMRPFFDDLVSQTSIENMFGLDLCTGDNWLYNQSSMTLGRLRETEDRLIYTDIVKEGYYSVNVLGMSVGGERLRLGCGDYNAPSASIVDSGTTNLIVPLKVFDALRGKLEPHLPANWTQRLRDSFFLGQKAVGRATAERFPPIGVMFPVAGNTSFEFEVTMSWDNYLRGLGNYSGQVHYLFSIGAMCIQESGVTLGSPLLTSTFVQFDRENKQIGFLNDGRNGCGAEVRVSAPRLRQSAESCSSDLVCTEVKAPVLAYVLYGIGGAGILGSAIWITWILIYGKKTRKTQSKCCGVPVATLCCFKAPGYATLNNGADGADDVGFFGSGGGGGEDSEMAQVAALSLSSLDAGNAESYADDAIAAQIAEIDMATAMAESATTAPTGYTDRSNSGSYDDDDDDDALVDVDEDDNLLLV